MVGGDLQINYVAGLALFFDLFPTCCRQPDLYPFCGGKAHGTGAVTKETAIPSMPESASHKSNSNRRYTIKWNREAKKC